MTFEQAIKRLEEIDRFIEITETSLWVMMIELFQGAYSFLNIVQKN